jgi:hypothetical protein
MRTEYDSFAYAAHTRTPKQKACLDLINEYTFLKEHGGAADRLLVLRRRIEDSLDDFATSCDHPIPNWIIPTIRAIALSSFGELREAIDLESEAMNHAKSNTDLSKNISNRGEYARQLAATLPAGPARDELLASAVRDGLHSMELSGGSNKGIALMAALALVESGMLAQADRIISEVSKDSNIFDSGDSLRAHLLHDMNFKRLKAVLPSVNRLYAELESR